MKINLLTWSLATVTVMAGCSRQVPRQTVEEIERDLGPGGRFDFVMTSATAVSNANRFGAPPDGFDIACDSKGHFTPRYHGVASEIDVLIRTSKWEAVVGAWRVKEVVEESQKRAPSRGNHTEVPTSARHDWHDCE
jgi:hypothetical protein